MPETDRRGVRHGSVGRPETRVRAPVPVAFHVRYRVGAREEKPFAAPWLACALPYRRFAHALADAGARLGADVDRYSFIAVDLHHLLLAGLPGAHRKNPQRSGWHPEEAFATESHRRAGIEGTLSAGVRALHLRRARYLGLAKMHLQHVLTAAAMTLVRLGAWFAGEPLARTRQSAFVHLMGRPACA